MGCHQADAAEQAAWHTAGERSPRPERRPERLALVAGEAHDNRLAGRLLPRLKSGSMLVADVAMMPIGLEPSLPKRRLGEHSVEMQSRAHPLQPRTSTVRETWSNDSLIK